MSLYSVRLRHDAGTATLTTAASSAATAVAMILKAEGAPLRAVQWVRVRPTCDYCGTLATLYDRNSGEGTPLCKAHAKSEYPDPGDRRMCTGKLGVTRLVTVEREQWEGE